MLNNVSLMGRLTKDPELRTTGNNTPYVNFTLAVERNYTDQKDEKQTDFIDCVAWRSTAEFICKYFSKGRMIALNGSLQVRSWTDKENNKRRSTEVVADGVYFCDAKRSDSNNNQNGNAYGANNYGGIQNGNAYGNAYGAPAGPGNYPGNNYGGQANGYAGNQGGGNGYPGNNYAGKNNYGGNHNNNSYGNNQGGQNYGENGGYTNYADANGFNVPSMPTPHAAPQANSQEPPVADMSQPYQNGFGGANDPKFNV